jgi:DNA polymerase delta subunit 1
MSDVECFNYPRPDNIRLEDNNKPLRFQIVDFFVPENDRSRRELNRIPEKREEINYNEDPPEYTVRLFGSTLEGYSVSAEITGYKPYFYIKVPDTIIKNIKKSNNKNGLKALSQDFKNYLLFESYTNRYNKKTKIISNYYRNHLVSVRTEIKKEFMGFTNNEDFYFLKIKVKSQKLFNTLKYFFNDPPEEFFERWGNEIFRLYESNIDPMLRFIHDKNILPCGWVEIPAKMYSILANSCDDDSYCRTTFTVEADHNYLKPLSVNSTAPITIVSFDIECTSSHGDFPVAIKDYGKLAKDLITISKNIRYTKEELIKWIMDAYSKEIVITGDCKIHRLYTINKVNLEQVERKLRYIMDDIISLMKETSNITYDDEENEESPVDKKKDIYYETVIKNKLTWKNKDSKLPYLPKLQGDAIIQIGTTVHKYGSDEIIYKNIISLNSCSKIPGTEVQYYKTEAEVLKAWKNLIIMLDPDILMGYNIFGFDMPYIWERSQELDIEDYGIGFGRYGERECVLYEQNLSSAALGDNILRYFDLDGVVLVDMYKVMQRTPLDSYKLDFVAQLYLGDKKDDLKPYEIFERFKGNADDRKVIAEYCIQDCALVNRLFHKLKVLENNNAMGNVCLVPLSYLFMRGQGVKIFSLVAQFCKNENHAIPVLRNYGDEEIEDESGYEGAIVLNPMEGMYLEDAITVLDYSSLYPSSMIERNLSHDCYVNNPKYDNIPGVNYVTVTYDIYEGVGDKKTKVAENKSKFVQLPNNEKGIIPRILMKLLTQRKNTRKKMEYETITLKDGNKFSGLITKKDNGENVITDFDLKESWSFKDEDIVSREETYNNFEKDVFDALQLAYKVTANSLYGQIGSRVSPIYLKDIAACTTATGRERIMMAKEYVEKNYDATVIYGDTDSIFIKFNHQNGNGNPIKGRETLSLGIKAGQRASDDINKILPPPQNLEYEKTFFPFIIFSKKRYVGLLYEDDPNKKPKQKSMGIVLKRRDNAPIVKKIYGGIIDILLNKYDLNASVEFLQNELQKLINGEYPLEDLIITKTLKGNYKDRTKIAHCVLADRMGERDPGNKPQINDRIPYVYIKTEGEVKLQGDRIEFPEYIIDNNITPDYQFYITNQLMKPICQIFALCVEKLPNYPYGEDHWERWNEELKDNAIYSSSELKRKNRISALKEQEVENLLFSQFIDKKKRNTNLPSLKTKSTKKKQIVEHEISEDAPKLVQEIFDIKADKITKERASYCVDIKLYMNNEIVYTNIFKKPKSNKGVILNKNEFITQRMVVAIKEISKNKEYVSMIENKGLYLGVNKTYKNYLSKAIDALNNNTDMPFEEELKKAEEELDTEKLKELHIIQHTSILPGYLSNIKYKYI